MRNADTYTAEDLKGQPCGGGFDLSRTDDTTALSLVFPLWTEDAVVDPVGEEGEADANDTPCRCLTWYWLPEGAVEKYADQTPYREWARTGRLRIIPGTDVMDYSWVERDFSAIFRDYDVRRVYYDKTYAAELVQRMIDIHGFQPATFEVFPQTMMAFTGPAARFERRIIAGKFRHNSDPILTWQVGHVQVKRDNNENMRPVKPATNRAAKIDGVVASIMAMHAADLAAGVPTESFYATHGMVWA
jgi:phage terminase large subunit-like protein